MSPDQCINDHVRVRLVMTIRNICWWCKWQWLGVQMSFSPISPKPIMEFRVQWDVREGWELFHHFCPNGPDLAHDVHVVDDNVVADVHVVDDVHVVGDDVTNPINRSSVLLNAQELWISQMFWQLVNWMGHLLVHLEIIMMMMMMMMILMIMEMSIPQSFG